MLLHLKYTATAQPVNFGLYHFGYFNRNEFKLWNCSTWYSSNWQIWLERARKTVWFNLSQGTIYTSRNKRWTYLATLVEVEKHPMAGDAAWKAAFFKNARDFFLWHQLGLSFLPLRPPEKNFSLYQKAAQASQIRVAPLLLTRKPPWMGDQYFF